MTPTTKVWNPKTQRLIFESETGRAVSPLTRKQVERHGTAWNGVERRGTAWNGGRVPGGLDMERDHLNLLPDKF